MKKYLIKKKYLYKNLYILKNSKLILKYFIKNVILKKKYYIYFNLLQIKNNKNIFFSRLQLICHFSFRIKGVYKWSNLSRLELKNLLNFKNINNFIKY